MRVLIRQDPAGIALLFQRGTEVLSTIDPVIAGAPLPAGPQEITELAELDALVSPLTGGMEKGEAR